MFLTVTLADIANRTIFSEYIPESAGLMIFAGALIASAVVIRKVLHNRDVSRRD